MWKTDDVIVTFSAGTGGSVNRTSFSVPYGSAVTTNTNTITINGTATIATANTGYSFSSWTNNCGANVTGACTITANFSLNSYTVTFASNTGGTVNRATQSVPYGTAITISNNTITTNGVTTTATPSTGYAFNNWTNNCGSTMPANDCTIAASFGFPTNTMQGYTKSLCQSNASSQNVAIKDARDGRSYRVRYINGVCTMIDNLNFQLTTGMSLSSTTTNITLDRTLGTVGTLTSGNSYDEMRILKSTTSDYGTYYNYAAATAGTITGSSNTTEASQDICPKGWKLPTLDEHKAIAGGSGYLATNVTIFNAVAAGYYANSSLSAVGSGGRWWSITAYDNERCYRLVYNTTGLGAGYYYDGYRYQGYSVRCVLK